MQSSIVILCFFLAFQLIPLLLVTKHKDGGYSLDDNELGVVFMVSAVIQLLYNVRSFLQCTVELIMEPFYFSIQYRGK